MYRFIVLALLISFSGLAAAQQINQSHQKYHVTYLKNAEINQQEQKKLRTIKLQNQQLISQNQQLNQQLQAVDDEKQQQAAQQQQVIDELQTTVKRLTNINVNLQQQTKFTSANFISRQYLLNFPRLNEVLQQLDLPLALAGALAIIILLLLLMMYQACVRSEMKQKLTEDNNIAAPQATEKPKPENDPNYNYLAGEDVVTAKLSLAHAYFDMEDYDSAKKILTGIVQEGTESQREEAKNLLIEINGASK